MKCYIGTDEGLYRVDMPGFSAREILYQSGFIHVPAQEPETVELGGISIVSLSSPAAFWLAAHKVNSVVEA